MKKGNKFVTHETIYNGNFRSVGAQNDSESESERSSAPKNDEQRHA